ncbi:unnamed protein product [Ascophyllum nodosum]
MSSTTRLSSTLSTLRRRSDNMKLLSLVVCSLAVTSCGRAADPTHGAVVGDVTWDKATVWSRSDENSTMQVVIFECGVNYTDSDFVGETEVNSTSDYTGLVDFSGLTDRTCYRARVTFADENDIIGSAATANFTTAPTPEITQAVKFAWSGDMSGQNVCRDIDEGFPIMNALNAVEGMDFFLNVGDAIYGDGFCTETGLGNNTQVAGDFVRSYNLENYWAHWKYNLADPGYQTLLSSQAFFMTWDDHEVVDNFGPGYDTRKAEPYTAGVHLLPIGMEAFLNYNPIRATSDPSEQLDFYRKVSWGKSVDLFVLDCRQYRSLPTASDTTDNPKTMLGATQLEWLKDELANSTALWKILVTSVTLSVPTGPDDARDGWANMNSSTGYEIELREILRYLSDQDMHNVVFISADVHFAQVLKYEPFSDVPDFDFYEIMVGPLNAGPFNFDDLDQTFSPKRLFMHAPEMNSLDGTYSFEELKEYFSFGVADVDIDGNLTFSIINTFDELLYNITLAPNITLTHDITPAPSIILAPSITPAPTQHHPGISITPAPSTTPAPSIIQAPSITPAPSIILAPSITPAPT